MRSNTHNNLLAATLHINTAIIFAIHITAIAIINIYQDIYHKFADISMVGTSAISIYACFALFNLRDIACRDKFYKHFDIFVRRICFF